MVVGTCARAGWDTTSELWEHTSWTPSPTPEANPQLRSQARAVQFRGGKARKALNGHLRGHVRATERDTATASTRKHSALTQNLRVKSARGQDRIQTWEVSATEGKTKRGEHVQEQTSQEREQGLAFGKGTASQSRQEMSLSLYTFLCCAQCFTDYLE